MVKYWSKVERNGERFGSLPITFFGEHDHHIIRYLIYRLVLHVGCQKCQVLRNGKRRNKYLGAKLISSNVFFKNSPLYFPEATVHYHRPTNRSANRTTTTSRRLCIVHHIRQSDAMDLTT